MKKVFIDEMTREEFREMVRNVKVAVIPTGSTEQHGPHLPLKTDTANVTYIVRKAAEILYPQVIVTPPVTVGFSPHHLGYPGSLTLRYETFIGIIFDLCESLKRHGISRVAIINGHGGNEPPGYLAARRVRDELNLKVIFVSYWNLIPRDLTNSLIESGNVPGHAGEFETSLALAIYPELISGALPGAAKISRSIQGLISNTNEVLMDGYSDNPSLASAEKGKKIIEGAINGLASLLRDFIEKDE
ncbi:MAG: creatininase family protein [Candidatus Bathyarchaeia archaeon]